MQPIDFIFAALVSLVLVGYRLYARILTRLKTRHEAVWIELGRPSAFSPRTLSTSVAVNRLLKSSRLAALQDPQLTRMVLVSRWYSRVYLAVLIALLAIIVLARPLFAATSPPKSAGARCSAEAAT